MPRNISWWVFACVWLFICGVGVGRDPYRAPWMVSSAMVGVNVTAAILKRDAARGGA